MSKLVTPNKKVIKKLVGASTDSKLKQASLMSFFSKAAKPHTPSKVISNSTESKKETPVKENNASTADITLISDDEEEGETALLHSVLETVNTSVTETPSSEPIIIKKNSSSAEKNDEFMRNKEIPSSPTHDNPSKESSSRRGGAKKKISYSELSDDDEDDLGDVSFGGSRRRKRSKIVEDSEDEFVPDAKEEAQEEDDDDFVEDASTAKAELEGGKDYTDDFDDDGDEEFIQLLERKKKNKASSNTKTPSKLSAQFSAALSKSTPTSTPSKRSSAITKPSTPSTLTKSQKFTKENEERYQWLIDIRDAQKRTPTDPEYDPRSLYIPSSAWSRFTNFEKQFWEIKSKMWDCVVFFKKGKFYELYEKDAMIGHSEFDLKIAGGGRANMQLCGVPEMSFTYWATSFISRGYKVAKVDQVETGLAKEIREENAKGSAKKDVIRRELTCVLTAGTLTEESMLSDDMATYCLSVKETPHLEDINMKTFGVSFIDTATGSIQITQFDDDAECSKLETLMSQVRPREVVVAKGNLSPLALRIVKFNCQSNAIFNILKPDQEYFDSDVTFEQLCHSKYFPGENIDDLSQWPEILKDLHEKQLDTGMSSFGGLLWYLRSLKLDKSLISLGNISLYTTLKPSTNLVLDGQTLQNLEIFANSFDGTDKGTLFKLINKATTPFGKRMLRTWVIHPLMNSADINSRLDSVDQIMDDGELCDLIESSLMKLPDLERLVARVHAGSLKLKDFTRVIDAFEEIYKLTEKLKSLELDGVLCKLVKSVPSEFHNALLKWEDAFDRVIARNEDLLILSEGVEADYDESKVHISDLENQLTEKLREYRKTFKTQQIEYKDSGKELYTIELPTSIKVPTSWTLMGSNKKTKRYWSPEVEALAKKFARAKELHSILEESLKTRMLARFDENYQVWNNVISIVAKIDCLTSLAKTSSSLGHPAVRPEFIESQRGQLNFKELRHPCFNLGVSSAKEFIPNNINLGGDSEANIGLLTGANAAGKSTVLRMTCIAVILSQIGCYVPCSSAKLTPIDRIMTRLGANDNIMQGKSTFYVELSETKKILENSTPKSLLVIDELGRGGSSSDGFAIAESVLHHLTTHIQSLGFFATHYGSLYDSFKTHPQVKPLRMKILVNEEDKQITFLYKLEPGQSPGSFGMNVARMCGIADSIIKGAEIAAESFEFTSKTRREERERARVEELPLGLQSDIVRLFDGGLGNEKNQAGEGVLVYDEFVKESALQSIFKMIELL